MLTRRDMLRLLLAGVVISVWPACGGDDEESPGTGNGDGAMAANGVDGATVIVIGAGISGLAAARVLTEEGYSVIVVEARERVGGRIWTDHSWPGIPLDMGASWIHGSEDNPITNLARELDVTTAMTNYDNTWLWDTDGQPVEDDDHDEIDNRFVEMLDDLDGERDDMDESDEDDMALGDAVEDWIDAKRPDATTIRQLAYSVNTAIEHEYAADIADLSFYYFDGGDSFDGDDLLFPDGYSQIVHGLAEGLDVRLGHVVRKVHWNADGVTVTTSQETFDADFAVVTLPQGVLKAGYVTFSPALPEEKLRAIERMRMGILNKVYLRFPRIFWPEEPDMLGYVSERKGEWTEWLNIAHYTGQPVLLAFNAADYGRAIEDLTDDEIVAAAMATLRTMFGDDIPEPEASLITRWGADPYAHGSYSFMALGANPDHYDDLAAPVGGRVFFAGEATSADFAATVHGAYLSGLRAAEEILALE
jgi:monoamine oxidase